MHPKSPSVAWLARATLAAGAAPTSAQTPPDLSGKWVFADERNPRNGGFRLPLRRISPSRIPATVGRAVAYMASLSLDSNVLFRTVMATKMPIVGRG